jgi:hypothetical protein
MAQLLFQRWTAGTTGVTHLISRHEVPQIILHHLELDFQRSDVRCSRFGGDYIFQGVAFAQVDLDEPSSKHHALSDFLL